MPAPINLCHISVNQHGRIFDELLQVLASCFRQLGRQVRPRRNHIEPQTLNLLVGQTVCLEPSQISAPHTPYLVYQLEQLSREAGFLLLYPNYLELLAKAAWVFDYSPHNLEFLAQAGLNKVSLLPLAFDPSLQRFEPTPNKDIDLIFFGAISERREKILQELSQAGVKVRVLCGVYGQERDHLLSRAKIVLNIHQFEHFELEELRLSYLVSNCCCVVSEGSDRDPYAGGVVYADYNNLAKTCLELLAPQSEPRRLELARRAKEHFQRTSFLDGLRAALSEAGL